MPAALENSLVSSSTLACLRPRLKSGALLMVRNNSPDGKRSHMTAFVSDDDGATWKGGLLLNERESSYPEGIQAEDGTLFIIYDHQRYTFNRAGKPGVGSVQIAVFLWPFWRLMDLC
ncbi:MAG: sialidase family protein [Planctomycetota bacterium]|nr:sialidase family protein [Planctomycetota bacterium]